MLGSSIQALLSQDPGSPARVSNDILKERSSLFAGDLLAVAPLMNIAPPAESEVGTQIEPLCPAYPLPLPHGPWNVYQKPFSPP